MRAEIIAIGDELTSGQRLDTNSQWLSQRLAERGISVAFHTTVGDDLADNVRVLREAADRVTLVIVTGGLGPTADDLTRQALADAAQRPLVTDAGALEHLHALFARRKRPMPERNLVQAMFPEGSRMIPNPHGSAPGIDMQLGGARIFALPGVPAEMRQMWDETVASELAGGPGGRCIRQRVLKCFGVGESDLEQMLPDLIERGRTPTVGITVHQATITLRITADAESPEQCAELIAGTERTIQESLGPLLFGEESDELQHAVVRQLAEERATLAIFEWGTGGLVSNWLAEADPEGQVFVGGTVLRRDLASLKRAADPSQPLESVDPAALAEQVRRQYEADYGLAIGPFPLAESPSPEVGMAWASTSGAFAQRVAFVGHPDILRERCGKQALDLVRLRKR